MKTLDLPDAAINIRRQHGFVDDFNEYVTGDRWTLTTDTGAGTILDAAGGVIALTTTNVDNDETYLYTTKELFKIVANKPIFLEAFLQFTEIATDDANIVFGLMDAPGANAMVDAGAGPKASYSGAVFFKQDGETLWSVENSITTTQKTTQLILANSLDGAAHTAGTAALYQRLGIWLQPISATKMDVMYYVNGVLVAKHKDQVWTGFTEAGVILGVKAGDTAIETLNVDYISAWQLR